MSSPKRKKPMSLRARAALLREHARNREAVAVLPDFNGKFDPDLSDRMSVAWKACERTGQLLDLN